MPVLLSPRVPVIPTVQSITLPPWSFRHRTEGIQFPLAVPFSVGEIFSE